MAVLFMALALCCCVPCCGEGLVKNCAAQVSLSVPGAHRRSRDFPRRPDQYFINRRGLESIYLYTAHLVQLSGCSQIGLEMKTEVREYLVDFTEPNRRFGYPYRAGEHLWQHCGAAGRASVSEFPTVRCYYT